MRTIGIDLAVQAAHKAVVVDEQGRAISPLLKFRTKATELDALLTRACQDAPEGPLQAVMESTGLAWFPVAAYLLRHGVTVYVVNSQEVADLRRYYRRHAKSDRIDARVLAQLPRVNPDKLHPLHLPTATLFACQRGWKQLDRWMTRILAIENRLIALDRLVWPPLEYGSFDGARSKAVRWFREHCYNPYAVVQRGAEALYQAWEQTGHSHNEGAWIDAVVSWAPQVVALYGDGTALDFDLLQQEACREQQVLELLEELHHTVQLKVVRPLYRRLHPSRHVESIRGVGQDGAAVYVSFIGDPNRFGSLRQYRGWSGMVPNSKQSAQNEAKGLHITQAEPNLIKKYAYLDANVARQFDPQLAALYYDQIVHKGKHHNQALCVVATHLLNRVMAVLRADQPYELHDVAGHVVDAEAARQLIAERYTVPKQVRQRQSKRQRQERVDRRAEQKQKREGCAH